MGKKGLYALFLLALCSACSDRNKKDGEVAGLVGIEPAMETDKNAVCSELYDSLACVPLETTDASLLGANAYILYGDDSDIFIRYDSRIYRFAADGRFLNVIGQRGNGPHEYAILYSVSVDAERERLCLYVGQGKVQYWGYDGQWQGECQLQADGELTYVLGLGENLVAENRLYTDEGLTTSLCVYGPDGTLLQEKRIGLDNQSVNITMTTVPLMYAYGGGVRYKDINGDSLYAVGKGNAVEGVARFHLGRFQPSREQLEDMNQRETLLRECAQLVDIRETKDNFYLTLVHDRKVRGIVMGKVSGKLMYSRWIAPPQRGGGIRNDYVGGEFWPSFVGSDDALYGLLPVEKITQEGEKALSERMGRPFVVEEANPIVLKVYEKRKSK